MIKLVSSGQRELFALGFICVFFGCGDPTTPPPTCFLDVSITTAGPENDPDGFAILVDDLQRKSLPGAGHAVITGLEPGRRSVALGGLAPTCVVTTENPLSVEIQAGASARLSFEVSCTAAPTGRITVISNTTGTSLDPNGYGVWVDGNLAGAVRINDTLVVTGLAAGDHLVELREIASACAITGPPSLTVAVTPPGTTVVTLSVTCTTPPGPPATIAVLVTTQVFNVPFPDHYSVVLDGGQTKTIPPNGSTSFATVAGFGGSNTHVVTVAAGATETVRFGVLCIP